MASTNVSSLFDWVDGEAFYRGLRVRVRTIGVGGDEFRTASLHDAAALLDDPELVEEFQRTDRLPYGLELWPAAVMLAKEIERDEPGTGRSAIELGCGVGLVSIVAARHGWKVQATDVDPAALAFARYNADLNRAPIEAFRTLDWRHGETGRYTRVFAADVLYQLCDQEPLLRCVAGLLAPSGLASICDPMRGVADRFEATAGSAGFEVTVASTTANVDGDRETAGRIFTLRR